MQGRAWVHHEKHRYYRVYLEQDLFGDWAVRMVWGGRLSRRGGMRSIAVASYEEGLLKIRALEKRRRARGYVGG